MTDRELLELAAKAAHYKLSLRLSDGGLMLRIGKKGAPKKWNPLTDDGDALRLAVKLGITVEFDYVTQTANALWVDQRGNPEKCRDQISKFFGDGDASEATRRAIVRAAAEIGKELK